jgi:predicted ATP-dependent endonuclease of OLD family
VRDNKNVLGTDDNSKNDLKFLKKHIKYKVSELFFSDAIILVEGITEEHILQHYINETYPLNKYGISIFNITGAYAHIYKPLIDLLKIPCLVITDLDVKRSGAEKGKEKPAVYTQISKLEGHETTNAVLHRYICKKEDLNDIEQPDEDESKSVLLPNDIDYFTEGNFKVVFQKDPIHGYIASSFEEAYILTNHKNDILNEVLKELKPRIYNRIVCDGDKENRDNSKNKSFEWQCKLSSSKSDFSNRLLYQIIITDEKLSPAPLLPTYIMDGLTWLSENINAPSAVKEEG